MQVYRAVINFLSKSKILELCFKDRKNVKMYQMRGVYAKDPLQVLYMCHFRDMAAALTVVQFSISCYVYLRALVIWLA
jgi:hypothetical protein